jgi:serine/threonine protein kinase
LEQNGPADDNLEVGPHNAPAPKEIGDFTILREIGRGGMGVVYEAVQQSLGRHVALKVLSSAGLLCPRHLERFRFEARAAARLHHSHIVPVYGVGEDDGLHYYAMQFIRGQSLDMVIAELRSLRGDAMDERSTHSTGNSFSKQVAEGLRTGQFGANDKPMNPGEGDSPIFSRRPSEADDARGKIGTVPETEKPTRGPKPQAALDTQNQANALERGDLSSSHGREFYRSVAQIGLEIAGALAYAHSEGVLHRDIKPSNVLLDAKGTVWITDFGLAKADDTDELTQKGDFVGTLRYMAPERLQGRSDCRSDIYGLGATLYELMTLRSYFEGQSGGQLVAKILNQDPMRPSRVDRHIPRDLETVILKAVSKEPDSRYQTAEQMAEDLRRFLSDRAVTARRSTQAEQFVRWCRRNPTVASLSAAIVIMLVCGVVVLSVGNVRIRGESAAKELARLDAERARRNERSARQDAEARAEEIRQGHERLKSAIALVDRANLKRQQQYWDDATIEYSEAIEAFPQFAAAWEERGDTYFRLGLIELAAYDINQCTRLQPPQVGWKWFRQALLRAYVNDLDGYSRACRDMHTAYKRARIIQNPESAVELVRASVLMPHPDVNHKQLIQLLETALDRGSRAQLYLYALGAAHFRAGDFEGAVEASRESLAVNSEWDARPLNFPILAMAHYRLGNAHEAATALNQANAAFEQWISRILQTTGNWNITKGATENLPIDPLDWLEFLIYFREAQSVLGVDFADEPRLVLRRARALAALQRSAEAVKEYERAVTLAPNDRFVQLEAARNLAHYYIHQGRYDLAAGQYAYAVEQSRSDADLWWALAAANLAAGRDADYRSACESMLKQFADTSDTAVAMSVLAVGLCHPELVEDWRQLLPLAQIAGRHSPGYLAAVKFRAGDYAGALQTFRDLERLHDFRPIELLFLAMTHRCLGQHNEAERRQKQAEDWIREADTHLAAGANLDGRPKWGGWTERPLTLEIRHQALQNWPTPRFRPTSPQ